MLCKYPYAAKQWSTTRRPTDGAKALLFVRLGPLSGRRIRFASENWWRDGNDPEGNLPHP
jgi:hypothetical protein